MINRRNIERRGGVMLGTTIFLSAFLLFQLQPLLGRYILPWFGGMPEVWTTCMLFFQVFLLAGYAYAHALSRLNLRWQVAIHTLLALVAAATLSIIPNVALKPTPDDVPVVRILWICTVSVGAAYFVLSATSPLIQRWFAHALPHRDPYRLYALSNAGSLLALASFPFVFEPLFSRDATAGLWMQGFYGYAAMVAVCAVMLWFGTGNKASNTKKQKCGGGDAATNSSADAVNPTRRDMFFWVALPMAASIQLLAVTNKLTLDIAVTPFLWVLPLSLYLLSFILCFDHPRWYRRGVFMVLTIVGILGHIWAARRPPDIHAGTIITIYAVILFSCCMICHGELYRIRPASRHLTRFYLLVAIGGALGGFFVAVVAPMIFKLYHELQLGIVAAVLLVLLCQKDISPELARRRPWWAAALCVAGLAGVFLQGQRVADNQRTLETARNFFGVLMVVEEDADEPEKHKLLMQHGMTYHGLQFRSNAKRLLPTSYYSPESGIGLLMMNWPKEGPRRIGIVGLGVGTLAAYGEESDIMRFYEINPEVERMCRQYFSYLNDSHAEIEVVVGDARLSMEFEQPQQYDVLALDAFSSDSVPVHLLTVEAFEIYLSHMVPDGVLALHISTQHLDLQSVVWKLAERLGLKSRWIESYEIAEAGAMPSDWILLSRNEQVFDMPIIHQRQSVPYSDLSSVPLWTDDHINILKVLRGNSP